MFFHRAPYTKVAIQQTEQTPTKSPYGPPPQLAQAHAHTAPAVTATEAPIPRTRHVALNRVLP